ncbi:MAG: bifunctional DNA-binding transcriptional regulator/O6-methylguanine-DNA methyltransferase Ada [Rhodospirillaceae bacterium]
MTPSAKAARAATLADPRWPALLARDAAGESFVYAVVTTGVYCRPECPSRRARPENVRFFACAAEAEAAGFRPCRRCRPDAAAPASARAALIASLCRTIESAEQPPRLADLAAEAGMSPWHLHRLFKAATGVTPRAYAAAHRIARVQRELEEGGSVTRALYAAGYNASSRFYAEADAALGMTPKRFRSGGAATAIRYAFGESTLGTVLAAWSERGVCAIFLGDDAGALVADLHARFPAAEIAEGGADFAGLVARVAAMIETPAAGCELPLDIRGTAFQRRVWEALRRIPAGETRTYAEIAAAIGAPRAVRAVGTACGANPIAVAVPCHRAVRSDGTLAGYRWGLGRKRALLDRERGG